ncbi:MAG: hypothetical protein FWD47_08300 [Treponema sp.]|nr:hypothetical protein [Treponema sp.]
MDEGFEADADTSVDVAASIDIDTGPDISLSESIEPLSDIPVEAPIAEQELSELQNEAAALEVEPYEPSALSNILTAGASGSEPGALAQIGGEILAPPGAGDVVAQGLQMGANAAIEGSREFMEATVRQHGESPVGQLENMQIHQAIANGTPENPVPLADNEPVFDASGIELTCKSKQ